MLSIAGSDSGGGAGIQADIKTADAIGCFATTAITAVTVQNTLGVSDFVEIDSAVVAAQIEAVLADIGADAVKTGMLPSGNIINSVATVLRRHNVRNLVVDPVMVSTSGHKLMNDNAIEALKNNILPLARVITPNIPEAEILIGNKIATLEEMTRAASLLGEKYSASIMLKAGHFKGEVLIDVLFNNETQEIEYLSSTRVNTINTHGTGCTLSAAIASYLAQGYTLSSAVNAAKKYLYEALIEGANYKIGNGHGPVRHNNYIQTTVL